VADVVHDVCVSCGKARPLKFCEHCGEKRITAHDYSIVHFSEHVIETFTHFDIKSLKAVKLLLLQPGELTRAYLHGRRKAFIGPIQLFVIVNVLFALTPANTFKTPLAQQRQSWLPALKHQMIEAAQAKKGLSDEEFEREFDRNAVTQAKTWIFSMISSYAMLLAVLYGFRRYFFEHLVLATHFMAWLLLWILVAGASIGLGQKLAGVRFGDMDGIVSVAIVGGMVVYLSLALMRVYGDKWFAAVPRAVVLSVALVSVLRVYRMLLFFVTLYTLH